MSDKTPGELIAENIVTLGDPGGFDKGGIWIVGGFSNGSFWFQTPNGTEETARAIRFAFKNAIDAAVAAEREACAAIAADPAIHAVIHDQHDAPWSDGEETKRQIAAAIRARG
jgi:hypothetical protein